MFTLAFWRATAERVVASFVGAVLAVLGGNAFDVTALDWGQILKVGAGAALVSLLKAMLAATATGGGPSFTNAETLTDNVAAVEVPVRVDGEAFRKGMSEGGLVAGPAADVPEGAPVEVTLQKGEHILSADEIREGEL